MYCTNCGQKISEGMMFCGSCGSKICTSSKTCIKCGAPLNDEDIFCVECGAKQDPYINFEESNKNIDTIDKPKKSKRNLIIIILVLIIIILAAGIASYFYYIINNENKDIQDSEEIQISSIVDEDPKENENEVDESDKELETSDKELETEDTKILLAEQYVKNADGAVNVRSEAGQENDIVTKIYDDSQIVSYYGESTQRFDSNGNLYDWYKITLEDGTTGWVRSDLLAPKTTEIDSKGYATYENTVYGYKCKYPSWFKETFKSESVLNCESKDGKAKMQVQTSNFGYSVQETIDNYISSYGNVEIDYESVGDNYFAIRLKNQEKNMYYYRYSKFVGGLVHSFTLEFPGEEFQTYDDIINIIYADFSKQF